MPARLRAYLLLAAAAPSGCLAWYAPNISPRQPAHATLTPRSTDQECLQCHRPLDAEGQPLLAPPATHHAGHHEHGVADAPLTAPASGSLRSDALPSDEGSMGLWFPGWMLEEGVPCVDCHHVR